MPFTNNRGVHIRYEVEGHGPPLVLLHGFSENLRTWYWKGFVEALQDTYQLILLDVRGHGASDKPHDSAAYALAAYAADVVAVLDALEIEQAHYFGYSLEALSYENSICCMARCSGAPVPMRWPSGWTPRRQRPSTV